MPEQPPGRTATRRHSSGWSSASMSSLTLVVAVSVRAIIAVPPQANSAIVRLPDRDRDPARVTVVQRREVLNASPADRRRRRLRRSRGGGCTPARGRPRPAPGTGSAGRRCRCVAAAVSARGLEAEPVHLADERLRRTSASGCGGRLRRPSARPISVGFVAVGADPLGQRGEQPGEQRVARRVEPEPGRARRQRVDVLGPADGAAVDRLRRRPGRLRAAARGGGARCWRAARASRRARAPSSRRVEPASSRYIEKRVSSPSALSTASRSISLDGTSGSGIFSRSTLVLFAVTA